jgi:hypothetical protein
MQYYAILIVANSTNEGKEGDAMQHGMKGKTRGTEQDVILDSINEGVFTIGPDWQITFFQQGGRDHDRYSAGRSHRPIVFGCVPRKYL